MSLTNAWRSVPQLGAVMELRLTRLMVVSRRHSVPIGTLILSRPVDQIINNAKGAMMGLEAPISIDAIAALARNAAHRDTPQALDMLLSEIRIGFAVFDYARLDFFRNRWLAANRDIAIQMGYTDSDLGIRDLEQWWTTWSEDYYRNVGVAAHDWTRRALAAAMLPFVDAHRRKVNLSIYEQALASLLEFEFRIATMVLPPTSQRQSPAPW